VISQTYSHDGHYILSRRTEPRFLPGFARNWRCVQQWSLDYLAAHIGDAEVGIECYKQSVGIGTPMIKVMKVRDFLEEISGEYPSPRRYLAEQDIHAFPQLHGDVFLERAPMHGRCRHLLFVGRQTYTPWHYHEREHALLVGVIGHKQVTLCSPDRAHGQLKPRPWYSLRRNFGYQHKDAEQESFRTYTVEPGDALYIPVHWWHDVRSDGISVSVTSFWRAPLRDWSFPTPTFRTVSGHMLEKSLGMCANLMVRCGLLDLTCDIASALNIVDDAAALRIDLAQAYRIWDHSPNAKDHTSAHIRSKRL